MNDIEADSYQWDTPRDSKAPDLKPYAELVKALAEKDREIAHLQDVYTTQRHKHADSYQQLMEKAVAIAEFATRHTLFDLPCKFLASPEVQAWRKEREI